MYMSRYKIYIQYALFHCWLRALHFFFPKSEQGYMEGVGGYLDLGNMAPHG